MRIAIVGKGTSAIISALVCIKHGYEVDIFFDPNKPPINVGESTTPNIGGLLNEVLDICIGEMIDAGIVSFKNGIKFINWGKSQSFKHHFSNNLDAFHFESEKFNNFVHQKLEQFGVKYHPIKISRYEIKNDKVFIGDEQYDFLISCAGWYDKEEYVKPIFETVNSAILYTEDGMDDFSYTLHRATEHGWQFGLPFPDRNLTKCGYLFNKKYNTKDEIEEHLEKKNCRNFSWTPRYAKKLLISKYEASNGNRLMFLEPLQALSLYYYELFATYICNFLQNRSLTSFESINHTYYQEMFHYQISLAFHYSYGSKFQSDFWVDVNERAKSIMNLNYKFSEESLLSLYNYNKKHKSKEFMVGIFDYKDYEAIHSGMLNINSDEMLNVNVIGFC